MGNIHVLCRHELKDTDRSAGNVFTGILRRGVSAVFQFVLRRAVAVCGAYDAAFGGIDDI